MAFWKKSDDPWDLREEKEEPQNSFQQYVDQWNAIEEREKAEKEAAEKAEKEAEKEKKAKEKEKKKASKKKTTGRKTTSAFQKVVNSAANTVGRELGKKIIRGLLDTFLK